MRIDLYSLAFETPGVTFSLWSPWRASALEHKLFEAVRNVPGAEFEDTPEERRINLTNPRSWRAALQAISRVLKGWQEDATLGDERRSWRWLLEGDTDANGYDHNGEQSSLWGLLRVTVERATPGEPEKGEDLDLEGFSLRIWPEKP